MLKIRFQRTGRRNDPAFRIVVGEHTKHPKSGSHAEILGSYHPKTKDLVLDEASVKEWMEKGAKPSPTVHNLLISKGIIEGTKINVLPKKTPIVKEDASAEATASEGGADVSAEAGAKAEAPTEEEVSADPATDGASESTEEAPAEEAEAPAEEEEKKEPA